MHDIIVPRRPTKSKPPRRPLPMFALSLAVIAAGLAVAAFFFGNHFFLFAGIVAWGAFVVGLLELRRLPATAHPFRDHFYGVFPHHPYHYQPGHPLHYYYHHWHTDPANPSNQLSPFNQDNPLHRSSDQIHDYRG